MGYRGEMECIIAKIFGSEAQKEATIEISMKTHGGRSFLHGHWFGDNVHDLLAPCIYEGEGEMLGMAFFKSLVKEHGRRYFEPIGKTLHAKGIRHPNLANPAHAWALKGPLTNYAQWMLTETARLTVRGTDSSFFAGFHADGKDNARALHSLWSHFDFAAKFLRNSRLEISQVMRTHQLKLPDRQCRMSELSARVQAGVVILCTSLYGGRQSDPLTRQAADVVCSHLRRQLTGKRASDRDLKKIVSLGGHIAEGGFEQIAGIPEAEILMPYEK